MARGAKSRRGGSALHPPKTWNFRGPALSSSAMPSRLRLSLFCSLSMGCAASPAPASQAPQTHTQTPAHAPPPQLEPATPAPASTAAADVPVVPQPAAAPSPPPTTCVITQEWWTSDWPRVLRTPSGLAFGTTTQAQNVGLTTQGGATLQSDVHGLRLRTTPRSSDLPLFARTDELLFAGVLQAGRATDLGWSPGDGPRMRVAPLRDARVRFVHSPELEVACADLSLMPGTSEHLGADRRLRARGSIAVAASPGGPTVLKLQLPRAVAVTQLDRNGPHAKIAWLIDDGKLADATVIGWVDARLVSELDHKGGGGGTGISLGGLEASSHWGGCQTEHPLLVDAGRGPESVGTILAGTRVRKGPRRGALVEVESMGTRVRLDPSPLRVRAGAKFLLNPDDATECSR